MANDWLTPAELAERWKKSSNTIYRLVREGTLPKLEVPGHARIPLSAVEAIEMKSRREETQAKAVAHRRGRRFNRSNIPDMFPHIKS